MGCWLMVAVLLVIKGAFRLEGGVPEHPGSCNPCMRSAKEGQLEIETENKFEICRYFVSGYY